MNTNYTHQSPQFCDDLLVKVYDSLNAIDEYRDFYLGIAETLSAQRVLDIGCGTGLLSLEMAERGCEVIGLEPAGPMLDRARAKDLKRSVRWLHGEASDLEELGTDLAVMTGHVAQFLVSDSEWSEALRGIYRALRLGGRLVFESRNPAVQPWFRGTLHRDWPTESQPRRVWHPVEGEVAWWMTFLGYESEVLHYRLDYNFVERGRVLSSENKLRFRSRDFLEESLAACGFVVESVFGDWDMSAVGSESPEFIFVARRV